MSGQHPSDNTGRKRDTSPSAYSQSSGLEWDPSADVGTNARHDHEGVEHPPETTNVENEPQNQAHPMSSEIPGPSTEVRPRPIGRSRSSEYPAETHHDHDILQHKASLGEIPKKPLARVYDWVKQGYLNPQDQGGSNFLETMVGGFNARRQFIDAVQPERPASTNSTVVSTIKPPPGHSRSDSQKSIASGTSSLPKDLQQLDIGRLPRRTGSNSDLAAQFRNDTTPRSHSMVNLGPYDSTTAPTGAATIGSGSAYLLDNDYSSVSQELCCIRRKQKDSSRTTNEPSDISGWLEVGMTKSEKEYKRLKERLGSGNSSSLMFVEIQHKRNTKNESSGYAYIPCRNVGIQTSKVSSDSSPVDSGETSSGTDVRGAPTSQYSSIYHSTPAERPKQVTAKLVTCYNYTCPQNNEEKREDKKPIRRREKSPPQPFAAASRKSSHHHHHAHHVRNQDSEISSFMETRDTIPSKKETTSSSSELSPPCFFIDKAVKSGKSSIKKDDLVSAIEIHMNYHVKKVRHELKQLEKLNQLLSKNLKVTGTKKPVSPKKKSTSPRRQPMKPTCQPVKCPVAYFIPFQNCQGQYAPCWPCMPGRRQQEAPPSRNSEEERENQHKERRRRDSPAPWNVEKEKENEYKDRQRRDTPAPWNTEDEKENEQKEMRRRDTPATWDTENEKENDYKGGRRRNTPAPWSEESDKLPLSESKYNLQAAFERRRPSFLSRLKEREAVLARIKSEREIRAEGKREWIRLYGRNPNDLEHLDTMLPPKGPRLMTTKEMRELTQKHVKNLPEVREKKIQRKVEEEKKTNRIMSQVFAKQLQKGVLKGELNFVHSRSLLRR